MARGDSIVVGSQALWGGFSSFFSIWQVCIVQISPFFMAYMVGIFLISRHQVADLRIDERVALPFIAYATGFTVLYSLLIASGLGIGRSLRYNISDLRLISGIVILLVGLYILLVDRVAFLGKMHKLTLLSILSLLIGITFAIIYSPCITPTLSEIMGMAARPETASEGWALAFTYAVGLCLSFGLVGIGLILLLRKTDLVNGHAKSIKDICAAIVLVPGLLNVTGLMTNYKAFFLGLLV
jgi:cytochrome c-type biogenesis protein